MRNFFKQLFQKRNTPAAISRYKRQKVQETEQFLRTRRHCARPQAPMGFAKRSSATYYLTSTHNHL